jgi:hypothetical protein
LEPKRETEREKRKWGRDEVVRDTIFLGEGADFEAISASPPGRSTFENR